MRRDFLSLARGVSYGRIAAKMKNLDDPMAIYCMGKS